MTWALVPVKPKPEIPAIRGLSPVRQASGASTTRTFMSAQGTCGFGVSKWRLAGSTPCRSACTVLTTPTTPAADSQWPTLDLTDPTCSGSPGRRPGPRTRQAARSSMGSPNAVPVPCASR